MMLIDNLAIKDVGTCSNGYKLDGSVQEDKNPLMNRVQNECSKLRRYVQYANAVES